VYNSYYDWDGNYYYEYGYYDTNWNYHDYTQPDNSGQTEWWNSWTDD